MRVCIRCEGSATLGLGHVRRCKLLANELHELGVNVHFVTRSPETVGNELKGSNFQMTDISTASQADEVLAIERTGEIAVIDLLGDTEPLQKALHQAGMRFLVIDGSGCIPCWGRWIVDPYPISQKAQFDQKLRRFSETEYLGGAEFALYSTLPGPLGDQQDNLIAICMGGGDDCGTTQKILWSLNLVTRALEVKVYTGGLNPHISAIRKQIKDCRHDAQLLLDEVLLQPATSRARFGFSAGGVTCYEMASMGMVLMTLPFAENQRRAAWAWEQLGTGTHVGHAEEVETEEIARVMNRWLDDLERARKISRESRMRFRGSGAAKIALVLRDVLCLDEKCRQ